MDVFVVDFFTDGVKASQRPFWKWHNIGGWYTSTRLVILFHRRLIFSPPLVTLLHRRLLVRTHRRVASCRSCLWLPRQLIRIHPINRQYSHLHRNKPYLPPIDKVPHWPHFPTDTYSHITYKLWQHCSYSSRSPTVERYILGMVDIYNGGPHACDSPSAVAHVGEQLEWLSEGGS